MAADETNGWVYALGGYDDAVAVIRDTQVITTVPTVGHGLNAVAVTPNGWAYVASGNRRTTNPGEDSVEGNVMIISGDQVIGNLNLGRALLTHVVVDPVTSEVYVGSVSGKVIVLKGLQEIGRLQIGRPPFDGIHAMSADPRTGEVYVLSVFDLTRFKDGRLIDSMEPHYPREEMLVHPKTGDVYLLAAATSGGAASEVLVVRNMKEYASIQVGRGPEKLAVDPVTGNVYVTNSYDNKVTVIQGTEVIATIPVGHYPRNIGINPANGWVYVANELSGTVSVLGYP